MIGEQIPIYSIITFSDHCTLKNIKFNSSKVHVINCYQLYDLVSTIYNNSEDLLSDIQIEEIYNNLYPYTQIDDNIKQKHINNIYKNVEDVSGSDIKDVSTNKEDNNKNNEIIGSSRE